MKTSAGLGLAGLTLCATVALHASGGADPHATEEPKATLSADVLALYEPSRYAWKLPAWMPRPLDPRDNPTTEAKVELGRRLFYDKRLSINRSRSCASCHLQKLAFTDGLPVSPGAFGHRTRRRAMSLANVAYLPALTWSNPLLHSLEQQALVPLLGADPIEMGMAGQDAELAARLSAEPLYPPLFERAFTEPPPTAISLRNVARALAAFELTSEERADLLAFLRSLTDTDFLSDPALSDPWAAPFEPAPQGTTK